MAEQDTVGRVIDMIATYANAFLFGMLAAVVLVVLDAARLIDPGWESRIDGNLFATIVLGIFNSIVAGTVTESIAGTSLGKLILGYRVVSLEPLEPCRFVVSGLLTAAPMFLRGIL